MYINYKNKVYREAGTKQRASNSASSGSDCEETNLEQLRESGSCLLGLEALESVNLDVLNQAVELVLGVLVLVLLSADSHADLSRHVPDAIAPDEPVQARVNADVLPHIVLSALTLVNISA